MHVLKLVVGSHEIPAEVFFKAVPSVRNPRLWQVERALRPFSRIQNYVLSGVAGWYASMLRRCRVTGQRWKDNLWALRIYIRSLG